MVIPIPTSIPQWLNGISEIIHIGGEVPPETDRMLNYAIAFQLKAEWILYWLPKGTIGVKFWRFSFPKKIEMEAIKLKLLFILSAAKGIFCYKPKEGENFRLAVKFLPARFTLSFLENTEIQTNEIRVHVGEDKRFIDSQCYYEEPGEEGEKNKVVPILMVGEISNDDFIYLREGLREHTRQAYSSKDLVFRPVSLIMFSLREEKKETYTIVNPFCTFLFSKRFPTRSIREDNLEDNYVLASISFVYFPNSICVEVKVVGDADGVASATTYIRRDRIADPATAPIHELCHRMTVEVHPSDRTHSYQLL